jgi:hypothetical protein
MNEVIAKHFFLLNKFSQLNVSVTSSQPKRGVFNGTN